MSFPLRLAYPLGSTPPFEGSEGPPGDGRIGSALTDAQGVALALKTDHCEEGKGYLLDPAFRGLPRLEAWLCAFLEQIQGLEVAFFRLFTERVLERAAGAQLDGLGDLVGEPRRDRTDPLYRRFIRTRILVNRSNGRTEELYAIGLAAMPKGAWNIQEQYPATLTVGKSSALGGVDPEDLFRVLVQAKGGAIALTFIFTWGDETDTFLLDSTPAGLSDTLGLSSTVDDTLGGRLASVRRI